MVGFESWQIAAYLGMIALALAMIGLGIGLIVLAIDDIVTSFRRRQARRLHHTPSPEEHHGQSTH